MRVVKGVKNLENLPASSVVSIGNFDGLHLGHQKILKKLKEWGEKYKSTVVVMTFDPHPEQVLFPERELKMLYSREAQLEEFKKWGVELVILEPFHLNLAKMAAPDFLQNCILTPLSPKAIVVGYDFSFGAGRSGNGEFLKSQSQVKGYDFEVIEAFKVDGLVVSSTEIRRLVSNGQVAQAAKLLGRNYSFSGKVMRGNSLGAKIGFATANLHWNMDLVLPKLGVYFGMAHLAGKVFPAVANLGVRPTIENSGVQRQDLQPKLEVHLLNFNKNLYDQELLFEFCEFIRPEKKFSGIEELKTQIALDVKEQAKGQKK